MRLFKQRKPATEKKNRKTELMKKRRQDKVAENLYKGWNALERHNVKTGLSLYLHAVTIYEGNFKAVEVELTAAKRKGFLPTNFKIPANKRELGKTLKKLK